jgi:hypothetical protein
LVGYDSLDKAPIKGAKWLESWQHTPDWSVCTPVKDSIWKQMVLLWATDTFTQGCVCLRWE